mgnify:FL=1
MIPTGGTLQNTQVEEVQQPSKTYKLDFEKRRIFGMTDGLEAVKQAVFKILQTDRFRYLIYSPDYGMEWNGLVGANPAFIRSELRRRITEALIQDDRIEDVTDFQIDVTGDAATVRFTVVSSFGSFTQEVTTSV